MKLGQVEMAYIKFDVHAEGLDKIADKLQEKADYAQEVLAHQVVRDTQKYVPADTLSLTNRTQVRNGNIIYPGPYARYLYYGKVMVDALTGKGPMAFEDGEGNAVIRFRKGTTLKPTARDLQFNRHVHRLAQAFWFEASKAQNLQTWLRVMGRVFKGG